MMRALWGVNPKPLDFSALSEILVGMGSDPCANRPIVLIRAYNAMRKFTVYFFMLWDLLIPGWRPNRFAAEGQLASPVASCCGN
jgi:hypothetical protein